MNKNKYSDTFGCFERSYWQYQMKDFASVIPQYATYSLALVYQLNHPGNPYYRDSVLLGWIKGALRFWARMQNRDGSFDEAYPGDRSQPGTAFGLYFIAEAFDLIQDELDLDQRQELMGCMRKAAEFVWKGGELILDKRGDRIVSNHDAGAACALQKMFCLTGEKQYQERSQAILNDLLSRQSTEGWFLEYSGADIGYSTVLLFFLANYRRMAPDSRLDEPLKRLLGFLSYFVHPDGTMGGEYGCRHTFVIMPSAFELLVDLDPIAGRIAESIAQGFISGKGTTPGMFDDANLCSFPMISFLQAATLPATEQGQDLPLPIESADFVRYFAECGLFAAKTGNLYVVGSAKQGGVFRIYDIPKKQLCFINSGVVAQLSNGRILYSNCYHNDADVVVAEGKFTIKVPLTEFRETFVTPLKTALSRIFFPLLSRIDLFKKLLKALLRRMLITGSVKSKTTFVRELCIREGGVEVYDQLMGLDPSEDVAFGVSHFPSLYFYTRGLFQQMEEFQYDYELQPDLSENTFHYSIQIPQP